MRKSIFFAVFIFCFSGTVEAQFLKDLGNKIERATERAIERKVEERVTEEVEEALDSTFTEGSKSTRTEEGRTGMGMFGLSQVEPAASYAFNHRAEMQMTTEKDVMNIDYLLPNTGNYFCAQIKDEKSGGDYLTVFDTDKEAMFTYMESDGKKMKMGIKFSADDISEEPKFEIKATGNTKTILGYKCQEYIMTTEDMTSNVWVTKDVDIRFPSTFYSAKQNKSNNHEWMKDIDGWAMEMTMVDTSKRKPQTTTMKCLSIEKTSFQINSSDYSGIGF